jgi:hypothetical protein
LAALRKEMVVALSATGWPALTPTMDEVATDSERGDVLDCGTQYLSEDRCQWGDPQATHTAVIVGDSISIAYVGALQAAIGTTGGWRMLSFGGYGCTFIDTEVLTEAKASTTCPERRQRAIDSINRIHPDLLFVANFPGLRHRVGQPDAMTPVEQESLYKSEVAKAEGAKKVVILAAPPIGKAPDTCYTKTSHPVDCVGEVTRGWLTIADADQKMAKEIGAVYVDSRDWFCYQDRCPSFVGSTPTKRDEVHLTNEYGDRIAPVILEQLNSLGLLRLERD